MTEQGAGISTVGTIVLAGLTWADISNVAAIVASAAAVVASIAATYYYIRKSKN